MTSMLTHYTTIRNTLKAEATFHMEAGMYKRAEAMRKTVDLLDDKIKELEKYN